MMRLAMAAAVAAAFVAAEAKAGPAELVDGWYRQYLGRCADASGLRSWTEHLRCGKSPEAVQACLLASDEYYERHGACDAGFIKGLYKDHLGRRASPGEVHEWLCELRKCCSREKMAYKFLCAGRRELAGRW